MSKNQERYYIETIGNDTTVRVAELLGYDSTDFTTIRVRGKPRRVCPIPVLEIEKVLSSPDHRDNVRIYIQESGTDEIKLCYPTRRA